MKISDTVSMAVLSQDFRLQSNLLNQIAELARDMSQRAGRSASLSLDHTWDDVPITPATEGFYDDFRSVLRSQFVALSMLVDQVEELLLPERVDHENIVSQIEDLELPPPPD